MGKLYYCDYCDRAFADKGLNRKNHFKGSIHQRLRKQHYDSFKDAASILADDASKLPCKRFLTGTCDFGDNCRFSHMTPERRQMYEQQVANERAKKEEKQFRESQEPALEDWLEKHRKRQQQGESSRESTVNNTEICHYELPPFLLNIPNLPPSLLPPTAEELKNTKTSEWG